MHRNLRHVKTRALDLLIIESKRWLEEVMQAQFTSRVFGIVPSLLSGVMLVAGSLCMPWALQATRPGDSNAVGGTFMLAFPSTADG